MRFLSAALLVLVLAAPLRAETKITATVSDEDAAVMERDRVEENTARFDRNTALRAAYDLKMASDRAGPAPSEPAYEALLKDLEEYASWCLTSHGARKRVDQGKADYDKQLAEIVKACGGSIVGCTVEVKK